MQSIRNFDIELNFVPYHLRNQSPAKIKKNQNLADKKGGFQIGKKIIIPNKLDMIWPSNKSPRTKWCQSRTFPARSTDKSDIEEDQNSLESERMIDNHRDQLLSKVLVPQEVFADQLEIKYIRNEFGYDMGQGNTTQKAIKEVVILKEVVAIHKNTKCSELAQTVSSSKRVSQNCIEQNQASQQNNYSKYENIFNPDQMEYISRLLYQDSGQTELEGETKIEALENGYNGVAAQQMGILKPDAFSKIKSSIDDKTCHPGQEKQNTSPKQEESVRKNKDKKQSQKVFFIKGSAAKKESKNVKQQKRKGFVNEKKDGGFQNKDKSISSKQQQGLIYWIKDQDYPKNISLSSKSLKSINLSQKGRLKNQYQTNLVTKRQRQLKKKLLTKQAKREMIRSDVQPNYITKLQTIVEPANQSCFLLKGQEDSIVRLMVSQDLKDLFSIQIEEEEQSAQLMDECQFKKELQQIINERYLLDRLKLNRLQQNVQQSHSFSIHSQYGDENGDHLHDINEDYLNLQDFTFGSPIVLQTSEIFGPIDQMPLLKQKVSQETSVQKQQSIVPEVVLEKASLKSSSMSLKKQISLSSRQLGRAFLRKSQVEENSTKFQKQLARFKTRMNC